MTQLGQGLFGPPPVAEMPVQRVEDIMGLRLEMVLAALESLRESLTELPTPQVFIDAPDLSAVVNAVNGLKPGADAEQIAQAVVRTLAPTATPAETGDWQGRLIEALDKLDFRLKGVTGAGTSNANLPALLTSAPASDTGQAALPVRVISQLGAGTGSAGGALSTSAKGTTAAGSPTSTSVDANTQALHAFVTNLPATQPVSGTVSVSNFPATQPVSIAATVPVSGAFWQATQPVSAAALPLPAGAATSAAQTDGTQKTQVTNFPATQAISAASLPLPTGAAQDGTDISSPTAMPAGGAGIRGWLSSIWTKLNGTLNVSVQNASLAVTGTFWQATQPVSLATNAPDVTDRSGRLLGHVTVDNASIAVTGTFFQATQPVSGTVTDNQGTPNTIANAWPVKNTDGTNTAAVKAASTAAAATDPALAVTLSPNSPLPAGANQLGTTLGPTLTKGTQGATGYSTQDLKDSGRAAKTMFSAFTSTAAAETAISFQVASSFGAPAVAAASYTVTAGTTLRIQQIDAVMRAGGTTPAASLATLKIKVGGNQQGRAFTVAVPTTVAAGPAVFPGMPVPFPDGFEIPAGSVLSFTLTLSAFTAAVNTPIIDINVTGFEY
jgi:hypothetical protein